MRAVPCVEASVAREPSVVVAELVVPARWRSLSAPASSLSASVLFSCVAFSLTLEPAELAFSFRVSTAPCAWELRL